MVNEYLPDLSSVIGQCDNLFFLHFKTVACVHKPKQFNFLCLATGMPPFMNRVICLLVEKTANKANMVRRKTMGRKKIPDRWLEYDPIKDEIGDAKIVAFKVPLPVHLFQDEMMADYKWTPLDVMEALPSLGLVIDLTFKFPCYYEPLQFLENGVDYLKIGCEGHFVPRNETYLKFRDAVDAFRKEHPDQIVGIHCTHGINRTGYMVCRYLVEKCGYSAEKAFDTFAAARGYPVERENYRQHIHDIAKSLGNCEIHSEV